MAAEGPKAAMGPLMSTCLHDALFPESRDLGASVPRFGEDLIGMLAETRRRAIDAATIVFETEAGARQAQFAIGRFDFLHPLAVGELRMVDDLGNRPDRGAGYVGFGQTL